MATVFKSSFTLTSPVGPKLKTDVMDSDQTLIIHDLSKVSGYPSQVNPLGIGVALVNLSTAGALTAYGFKPQILAPPFENKSLTLAGTPTGANMIFGSTSAPYPQLGIGGTTTDLLVTMWIKVTTSGVFKTILTQESTDTTGGDTNTRSMFQFGTDPSSNSLLVWFSGKLSTVKIPYTVGAWMQVGAYMRCDTLNGKPFLFRLYKNGAVVGDSSGPIRTTFYASDSSKTLIISQTTQSFAGSFGRISILAGLDSAGKDPNVLVANEYAVRSATWS